MTQFSIFIFGISDTKKIMAAKNKKVLNEQSKNNGSLAIVVNDSNVIEILVTQMRYLSNTLHHLNYIIQSVILSSNIDLHDQSTESTYFNVSNAFNYLHYFYDLLSYLEWELQYLRNNTSGIFYKKNIPATDKQYDTYVFRYDDKLNADYYYKKKKRLDQATQSNNKLKNSFYDLYDEIEAKFQEAKAQFNNYLNFIKCYNLHYELVIVKELYGLFDNKRKLFPNDSLLKLYNRPLIYVKTFINEFKTNSNNYDKSKYNTIRITSKKIDKSIIELTNTIVDQALPGSVITFKSLNLDSADFINYIANTVRGFRISLVMIEEVSYKY